MKHRFIYRCTVAAALLASTAVANAQVVISFNPVAAVAVPLSPWMAVLTAILVALGAVAMAKKHARQGISLMVAALVVGGGMIIDARQVVAGVTISSGPDQMLVSPFTATPNIVSVGCPTNVGVAYVMNATGAPITINNIAYDAGYSNLNSGPLYDAQIANINAPSATNNAPNCTIGMSLAAASTCKVIYQFACVG